MEATQHLPQPQQTFSFQVKLRNSAVTEKKHPRYFQLFSPIAPFKSDWELRLSVGAVCEGASLLGVHKQGSALMLCGKSSSWPAGSHLRSHWPIPAARHPIPCMNLGLINTEKGKAVGKHHIKQPRNGLMTELHFSAINSMKALRKSKYNENNNINLK